MAIQITSDNAGCVSCSGNTITAVAKGTAKLTVNADNYQTEYITVTVNAKKAGDLPINSKKITLVQDEKINIGINANDYPGLSGKAKDSSVAGVSGTEIQGKKAGKTTVTYTATGYNAFDIEVTVVDKKALLKLADGTQVYVKSSEGGFREATYADYYNKEKFFLKDKGEGNFKYKGWQTINGKTYYWSIPVNNGSTWNTSAFVGVYDKHYGVKRNHSYSYDITITRPGIPDDGSEPDPNDPDDNDDDDLEDDKDITTQNLTFNLTVKDFVVVEGQNVSF